MTQLIEMFSDLRLLCQDKKIQVTVDKYGTTNNNEILTGSNIFFKLILISLMWMH